MEHLWAPWRMAYIEIEAPPAGGCILCDKPKAADLRQELVLYRGETCFVIMNLFPYNNGHVMIAPYRHTADLVGLTSAEQVELMSLTRHCVRALGEAFRPEAFNIGMNLGKTAGAGIAEHLHMHVVPRWNGDTNFMPVLGDTKVLPDALFASYDRLAAALERCGPPE
jgi:ATP adenylyltransferase